MVRKLNQTGRLVLLTLSLLLPLTGCDKMLAGYNIGRAEKRVGEAEANDAQRFTPEQLQRTTELLQQARQERDSENHAAARQTARLAAEEAATLLEQTKTQNASYLRERASFWIDRARSNNAPAIDPERFNAITAANDKGNEEYAKSDWDDSIEIFKGVISDIDFLLKTLENDARAALEQARQMRQDLIDEGAPENAPEFVMAIEEHISRMETLISEPEYQYRVVIDQVLPLARQTRTEGITQTKRVKSQRIINQIEDLLEQANELGAELYAASTNAALSDEFADIITHFYSQNYDTVLLRAPDLVPRAEDLILETKRNGALRKMESIEAAINWLDDGRARTYLPTRVENLESLLADAREQFEAEDYMASQRISDRASELNKNIVQEFDTLAQRHITNAQDRLATADSLFNRMEEIFTYEIAGDWTGADLALENSKRALQEELRTTLNNARLSLGTASLMRERQQYANAIETSVQVEQTAEHVQQQTYRVVAHNAILEIANELTRYEREGGRQFAPQEVDRTYALLENSKQLMRDEQYRQAVNRAADTKAQLSVLAQELGRVAVDRIERAQAAIASARENRAGDFESQALQQAGVALERARESLQAESLRQTIESAVQAENIANEAATRALSQWSREYMEAADTMIARARQAGAERYAAEELAEAIGLRTNLQQLYDQAAFAEAVDIGRQAVDAANNALYALINHAEDAIAGAREYGAWEVEPQRLTDAMVSLKYARQKLETGEYKEAELHAYNAINLGRKLQSEARRAGFESGMQRLEQRLRQAERDGTAFYQVRDITAILTEMNHLRREFNPNGYEDYTRRVQQLEAHLAAMVERTPDVLRELVIAMQDRLTELEARGADQFQSDMVNEIEQKIKYAQIDYRAGKYLSSYTNARDAQRLLYELALHLDEREFDTEMHNILAAFTEELRNFSPVLNLGVPTVMQMVIGANGRSQALAIMQSSSPSELRANIAQLGSRVRNMKTPPTRENYRQEALELFSIARVAASNFEKMLILDQYSLPEARDIIQTAFAQMKQARKMQNDLMRTLQYPDVRFQPVGVERVVSFTD